ncbi:hypothetical protein B296_00006048 [Ensete ventricosum]|uniref:Uncharacterized protein n=1 Tax=Ensete ventricosum TaxID=4639 RepID=A0A427B8N9_ENSVE|nr:hypothetical protein B296_00006048 [Ensete ventricosum]
MGSHKFECSKGCIRKKLRGKFSRAAHVCVCERERGVFGTRIERKGTRRVVAQHLLIRSRTSVKRSAASLIVIVSSMKLALLLFFLLVSNFLPSSLAAPSRYPSGNLLVRVDISARFPGKIQAALTENRKVLHELILEPLREEQYYEVS